MNKGIRGSKRQRGVEPTQRPSSGASAIASSEVLSLTAAGNCNKLIAELVIRAVLGHRVRQLIGIYDAQGVRFFTPEVAFDAAEKYLPPRDSLMKLRYRFTKFAAHEEDNCEKHPSCGVQTSARCRPAD
jgi:hypothetical protein